MSKGHNGTWNRERRIPDINKDVPKATLTGDQPSIDTTPLDTAIVDAVSSGEASLSDILGAALRRAEFNPKTSFEVAEERMRRNNQRYAHVKSEPTPPGLMYLQPGKTSNLDVFAEFCSNRFGWKPDLARQFVTLFRGVVEDPEADYRKNFPRVSDEHMNEIMTTYACSGLVAAIKMTRERTDMELVVAKKFVELEIAPRCDDI